MTLKCRPPKSTGPMRTTYSSWNAMKGRCLSQRHPAFRNYGGRGISICERWLSFENFLADMGMRPPGTSLDRIDGDGNYAPGNCRWATPLEQHNNERRNRRLTVAGESLTIAQWARRSGVDRDVIDKRLRYGWDAVRAVTVPPVRRRRKESDK